MEDIFKTIYQLEIDTSGAIESLDKVNSKYKESNAEFRKTQTEINKLMAREAELLAARQKSNNPTSIVRYNAEILKTQEQINKLKTSIASVTKTEQDATKASKQFGDSLKQAFDATRATALNNEIKKTKNSFSDLRAQLKAAKGELADAFSTGNQAQIQRASEKVGKLKDELKDLEEQTAAFASGSKFQTIGNLGRGVFGDLLSFDFEGANAKSRALLATTQSITFAEAKKGISDLGGALANVGKSLLANPIFLLGAAITLIISNLDVITDKLDIFTSSADKNKRTLDELNASMSIANANLERQSIILQDNIRKLEEQNAPLETLVKHYKALEAIKLTQLNNELKTLTTQQEQIFKQVEKSANLNKLANVPGLSFLSFFGLSSKELKEATTNLTQVEAKIKEVENNKLSTRLNTNAQIEVAEEKAFQEAIRLGNEADDREAYRSKKNREEFFKEQEELFQEAIRRGNLLDDLEAERNKDARAEAKALREAIKEGEKADDAEAAASKSDRPGRIKKQFEDELEASHAHNQSLLRQRRAANSESLFEQLDYEKKKLEIMKQYGKATAAEIQAQQDRINEIEREATRQRQLEVIGYYEQLSRAAIDGAQVVVSAKQKEVEELVRLQEKRISDAEKAAEDGNAEALELERKRLEDLTKQREEFVKKQQALATIELIANSLIAISKAAAQGGVAAPFTIAATLIALTAGIIQARTMAQQAGGSFYEGGYTGDGNPREESRKLGKKSYTYHKGEFVFNHEQTAKYKPIFQDIHKGNIDLREWQQKVQAYEQMRALSFVSSPNSSQDLDILESKLDKVILAIEGQTTSVSLNEDGLSLRFKRIRSRNDIIKNELGR